MRVGIEDLAFYVPNIYLSIEEFGNARGIEVMKLKKGLGLEKMALPDYGEDAATMAANALIKLFEQNDLNPAEIGRIYLGTESALDSAKPTATYALEMLQEFLEPKFGADSCTHIDCVDMTFACIGAVDALQNTLDWVKAGKNRKGIVIASDFAKYELESTGEYTQGAGAVSALISNNPKLIEFNSEWAVSTKSVHDFFKPRRKTAFANLEFGAALQSSLNTTDSYLEEFRETPVFDGQFSNKCYEDRMIEAYNRFEDENGFGLEQMNHLVFHLPYAFHGRRIISSIFLENFKKHNDIALLENEIGIKEGEVGFLRAMTKSATYKSFIATKIAPNDKASSEVGNMYTASIFMALMSTLASLSEKNTGEEIGFIAYGSGSKSKIFSAKLSDGFTDKVNSWNLFESLNSRKAITFDEYLLLHTGALDKPLRETNSYFTIEEVKSEPLVGERIYRKAKVLAL
jgi:hydroxymethylglutaryl-CoA synthase